MAKISKLADYSVVILRCLAINSTDCFSATALAKQTGIARPTVSKILKLLTEAHLLGSMRGVRGGYRLARAAESINLAEILSAVDGSFAMTECCHTDNQCVHFQNCQLSINWQWINQIIYKVLSGLSLLDMSRPLNEVAIGVEARSIEDFQHAK